MSIVKAFRGLRPPVEIAEKLASRPYDVMNSAEARVFAFTIEDHSMGTQLKLYDDRSFCTATVLLQWASLWATL